MPRRSSWRLCVAVFLLGASFPTARWIAGGNEPSRQPQSYYAQLTDAFLSGQLHLKEKPDPRLDALTDPYSGALDVPRPWDVSYFNRRFYLYFSPVPALLFMAPIKLLSGFYLPDGIATTVFGAAGFGLGAWWLLRQQRRWLPELGEGWIIAGLAVWCLCSHAQALAYAGGIYLVPINAAFLCLTAAIVCWTTAWDHPARVRWLVFGGLLWGLAIACRPNYLFSAGGVLAFLLSVWMRQRSLPLAQRRGFLQLALAAGLPMALIGAVMLAYNWARFGQVAEFGTSYMLMAGDQRHLQQLDVGRIHATLLPTLLRPMPYSTYFPFAVPGTEGLLAASPLLLVLLALPWLWFSARSEERAFWRSVGTALLLAGIGNLLSVCMLLTQEFRYGIDYLPALMLVAVLVSWRLACPPQGASSGLRRTGRALLGLGAAVSLLHAAALNVVLIDVPQRAPDLARTWHWPLHWIEQALGYEYGPLHLHGRLPAGPPGTVLPLVVTGRGGDVLYVRYTGPNQVQFGFLHAGAGRVEGEPVELDLAATHDFSLDLGSLYPRPEHPLFARRDPREVQLLRQRIRVTANDRILLDGSSDFFASDPLDLQVGRNPRGLVTGSSRLDLSGLRWRRAGIPVGPPAARFPLRPVRMEVSFPRFEHYKQEPLLCTGRPGQGDLLYVIYAGPNQLRLAHDSPGAGSIESMTLAYEPGRVYTLDVDMGSLRPADGRTKLDGLLRLHLDGQPVLNVMRPFNPSEAVELAFGHNALGSGTVYPLFTGHIHRITSLESLPEAKRTYGAVRCLIALADEPPPRSDPLVTTGREGAGDIVYVTYTGPGGVRFGFDHWGSGGPQSAVIPVVFNKPMVVEISLGSLWPTDLSDPAWEDLPLARRTELQETVTVKVDGQVVLSHHVRPHPSTPAQVEVGANRIGASTCEPEFIGRLLSFERVLPLAAVSRLPTAP